MPDFGLVVGNPAKRIGWVCECGERLPDDLKCASCERKYKKKKKSKEIKGREKSVKKRERKKTTKKKEKPIEEAPIDEFGVSPFKLPVTPRKEIRIVVEGTSVIVTIPL